MKISVKRLKQIIKEEMENVAEYERAHEGKKCGVVHPGMEHDDWAEGEISILMREEYSVTNEELEDILEEDDWDFLEEEDLYED